MDSLAAGQILNADFPLEEKICVRDNLVSKPVTCIKHLTSVSNTKSNPYLSHKNIPKALWAFAVFFPSAFKP